NSRLFGSVKQQPIRNARFHIPSFRMSLREKRIQDGRMMRMQPRRRRHAKDQPHAKNLYTTRRSHASKVTAYDGGWQISRILVFAVSIGPEGPHSATLASTPASETVTAGFNRPRRAALCDNEEAPQPRVMRVSIGPEGPHSATSIVALR